MIILECESFYYLFKQLEEFEKRPFLVFSENKETLKLNKVFIDENSEE